MNWRLFKYAFINRGMRNRILIVIAIIIIFRMLSHIPIPIAEQKDLQQFIDTLFNSQQLLGFLDLLSGGALSNFSIMLMGLGPYINASIVMQLLSKAIPRLEALHEEGSTGRRKISQYTRILTLPFAIMQSIGMLFLVRQQAAATSGISNIVEGTTMFQWVLMVSTLVGASMLIMWLGELMSEQGVGNGISLIIAAGIISRAPAMIGTLIQIISDSANPIVLPWGWQLPISPQGLILSLMLVVIGLLATYAVIKLNEAQRIIKISYAKRVRGNRAYGGVDSVLPIKLITVGVIPIIFALAFLSVPAFVGQIMSASSNPTWQSIGVTLTNWFNSTSGLSATGGVISPSAYVFPIAYFLLVVLFTYFYTSIMFNSKELAESLQKQGGFIPGIRPGATTQRYLSKIVNRLTLFGSVSLATLAIMPFIIDYLVIKIFGTTISQQLTIGGTGLLIVVAVAIETLRQIESRALMVSYDADESFTS